MARHFLDKSITYNRWNRSYEPRLCIESGDTVTIEMNDASDGQLSKKSTAMDWENADKMKVHGLTGPIEIAGADKGDQLKIDIIEYEHENWAWTSQMKLTAKIPMWAAQTTRS